MNLHLFEKFILIALDQKSGRFLIDALSLNYGLAGAVLLELSEENKIVIRNKKIEIIDQKLTNNKVFDSTIELLKKTKKNRKARYWIYKIGNKSSDYKKIILQDLYNRKILKTEIRKFLWGLIQVKRYPIMNQKIVEDIKAKLKKVVLDAQKPDIDTLLLLSLMASCKLTRVLFRTKKEHREAQKRIKDLTRDIEISDVVSQTLKEIQTAVLVATTSAFVTSSSS